MKKRLHDKKAGIAILITLLIISLIDVILRVTMYSNILSSISNYGEALITGIFSVLLLVFACKGKDRVFYVLCGAWIAFFVMNQLYGLPNMLESLVYYTITSNTFGIIAAATHLLSIVSIIATGALLVEYLNDGSIYNKAFNTLCIITVALLVFLLLHNLNRMINYDKPETILAVLYTLSRLTMVFLFAFFAYDSANHQLKKVKLSK